jgi:biopolymer transport protein ExbD
MFRRWNVLAPWICILLLGLILFAIAVTIVISLISVYLPTRNITPVSQTSAQQTATIQLGSGSNVQTGPLSSTTQTSLQNQVRFNIE